MREHLGAAVAARGHDRRGCEALDELGDRARPRQRGVLIERVVLGHVDRPDAVRAQRARRVPRARACHDDVEAVAGRVAAREGQRLQRELVELALRVLDEYEDRHATPIRRSRSTTAGAASGPSPSTSAARPRPAGTVSRTISSRGARSAGSRRSTGLRRARSFAGTEG